MIDRQLSQPQHRFFGTVVRTFFNPYQYPFAALFGEQHRNIGSLFRIERQIPEREYTPGIYPFNLPKYFFPE